MARSKRDEDCFAKAIKRNQRTFTLVEQDRSSPATICFWIMLNIETAPDEKLLDALRDALEMRKFKETKNAD